MAWRMQQQLPEMNDSCIIGSASFSMYVNIVCFEAADEMKGNAPRPP
jgi:hypothetical protein